MQQPLFYKSKLDLQLWWATAFIIIVNVGLYLLQITAGVNSSNPSLLDAIRWGADYPPLTLIYEPYRLFTCMFFHFGFIHLALNMWSLYIFGKIAEQIYGRFYYICLYLLAGLTGSLLSNWITIENSYHLLHVFSVDLLPTVNGGASGAIMGLGGALTILSFFPPAPQQPFILSKKVLLWVMLINLSVGFITPNINNMAHIGGILMGVILSLIWYFSQRKNTSLKLIIGIIFGILLNLMIYLYCEYKLKDIYLLWMDILNNHPFQ
ncbi:MULTISPECIES: rhomboid family intramembrane serine protease [Acinetobacter]|uniref:rhomboid family intramembrane serine protease n=1 Tax=Acinetobacter TaxID=469 RepID=UPI0018A300CF|nr:MULTISPECIES: rhomboid family intramembrane serine protease [Acinetobacter]MBF7689163.1 rhomboid family intramembrane serine protease [Acinetobacter pollinis]MBF7691825.1 rhomboid family intramembrane serine protease [Acinetobacter pollinis]MBF7698329.1 rhomboid family intramembrane serine protease [Acinetobacter pollinis]MBF7699930.1 rhomboid family intramembrane serine protease [Acinetobacter pollinis]WEV49578.1 rhomboid family intramembrane serine protease [Acinetobacter sp. ESL0695]